MMTVRLRFILFYDETFVFVSIEVLYKELMRHFKQLLVSVGNAVTSHGAF